MLAAVVALWFGLAAAGALAWRWGPPRPRWSLADVFAAFALFVGLAGLSGSAFARVWGGEWVPDTTDLVPGLAGTAMASVAVSVVILRRALPDPLGLRTAEPWAWGWAVAGIPAFLAVSAAWATFIEWAGVPFESQQLLQLLGEAGSTEQALALGYGIVGAPLVEELLFRGFLLPPLRRRMGMAATCLLAGGLFGLVHMTDPLAVAPLVVLGVALSWLRLRTGSIWPGVVVHVGNNAVAMAVGLLAS